MSRRQLDRPTYGQYHFLFPGIRHRNKDFEGYLRMSVQTFDYILNKIKEPLRKQWCNLHSRPISQEERLVITIRFLATGQSYGSLALTFDIGLSTVSAVVIECMDIIWNIFQPLHMACPSQQDLYNISEIFFEKFQFPHCLGAVDGRHIRIKKPARSGTAHYNFKKFFSVVLQAHVDADYRYVTIDICRYGSQSDASIFSYSKLKRALDEKLIKIPKERRLPSSAVTLPYYLIGDGAYPLLDIMMKPFRGKKLTDEEANFNKRLSRARVVAENAFAKTCQKWRIFYTTIQVDLDTVEKIIKTTCILHNIILDLQSIEKEAVESSEKVIYNDGEEDIIDTDEERDIIYSDVHSDASRKGQHVREKLVQYLYC